MKLRPFPSTSPLLAWTLSLALLFAGCSKSDDEASTDPAERIDAGVELLRFFNFKEAYQVLSEVQPELPEGSEDWIRGTYSLAVAAWHTPPTSAENIREASGLFKQVVENAPDSAYAASALLELGRIAEIEDYIGDQPDLPSARDYYERVRRDFPDSDMAVRATLYLAQSYAQTLHPEHMTTAVELLEASLREHPESPWTGVVAEYTAQLYAFYLNETDRAIDPYLQAVEAGLPRKSTADTSLWQLGNLAEQAGRDHIAAEVYTRIVENYPRSIFGTLARNRVRAIAQTHPEADILVPELTEIRLGR